MKTTNIELCDNHALITEFLMDLPIDSGLTGYIMLRDAISLVMKTNGMCRNMYREVLDPLSKKYNVSMGQVDKAIRYLMINTNNGYFLSKSSNSFPNKAIESAFYNLKSKALIVALAEYILLSLHKERLK